MKRSLIITTLLGLWLLAVPSLWAQAPGEACGTVVTEAQIAAELEREAKGELFAAPSSVTQPYHIPLTIHIVRRSNGTGGFTLDQLDIAMQDINRLWFPLGVHFFQFGGVDYIDSDYHFNVPNLQSRRDELRQVNPVANTINVYFTNLAALCGQSSFTSTPIQGVLIDNSCAGVANDPSTLAHEVGHYFDLYHPHETIFGVECPNGSNCSTAGDRLCDTPADPNLLNRVSQTCVYDNSVGPPAGCGTTAYAPLTNNTMSYSRSTCAIQFTPSQISKAIGTLTASRRALFNLVRYVNPANTGVQDGSPERPFRTVGAAITSANPGNYIVIKSASYPGALNIIKRVFLVRWDTSGVVSIGQ